MILLLIFHTTDRIVIIVIDILIIALTNRTTLKNRSSKSFKHSDLYLGDQGALCSQVYKVNKSKCSQSNKDKETFVQSLLFPPIVMLTRQQSSTIKCYDVRSYTLLPL